MNPSDVLNAPAEYANELIVRSIGPCAVLVLERDAPLRLETSSSTDEEFDALLEYLGRDPRARAVMETFIEHGGTSIEQDVHADRLDAGTRISDFRALSATSSPRSDMP